MDISKFIYPFDGKDILKDFETDYTGLFRDKDESKEYFQERLDDLSELQNRLFAMDKYSLLIIFQAMDAAGKDSTIKHVMSGVDPQGCQVSSFKAPTSEELDHDYLWRCSKVLPRRGNIGIFNRSYYEEVLITRVHPEILKAQKLPSYPESKKEYDEFWERRMESINNFEKYLVNNGIIIIKFFLNVSKDEQKKRFIERITNPQKNWKFNLQDVHERQCWDDYIQAYTEILKNTSKECAPWHIIPADKKWFMRLAVCEIIVKKLESMNLYYPMVNDKHRVEMKNARQMLEDEDNND